MINNFEQMDQYNFSEFFQIEQGWMFVDSDADSPLWSHYEADQFADEFENHFQSYVSPDSFWCASDMVIEEHRKNYEVILSFNFTFLETWWDLALYSRQDILVKHS